MANITRSQRESRAYRLILTTGAAGVASAVLFVLAIVGIVGYGLFFLALVITIVALYLARRTLKL